MRSCITVNAIASTATKGVHTYRNSLTKSRAVRRGGQRVLRRHSGAYGCPISCSATDQSSLVVVGSINADLVFDIPRLPAPGETLEAASMSTFPGGKGANQAAAAAKLGCSTVFIGQVGDDVNSEMLRHSLEECYVDISHLRTVEGPSGTAVVLLQPSGENSILIVGGANTAIWEFSPEADEILRSAAVVLMQREVPEHVNVHSAETAVNAQIVLDCGGAEGPLPDALLDRVAVLSPNETELQRLTGMKTETEEEVITAARVLIDNHGIASVLVKRGAQGSVLISGSKGETVLRQEAVKVGDVLDTTGAGDCFTGAYAAALLQGRDQQEALRYASTAAGFCVCHKGAMPSLPWSKDLEQLI